MIASFTWTIKPAKTGSSGTKAYGYNQERPLTSAPAQREGGSALPPEPPRCAGFE
jgi:hypothetical protein